MSVKKGTERTTKGLNTAVIRQVNVARVFHALRRLPGCSQRDLVALTGLDRATVNTVVRSLVARGLVHRVNRASTGRVGRPEGALEVSSGAGVLLGARLEPGGVKLLATDLSGAVLGSRERAGPLAADAVGETLRREVGALAARLGVPLQRIRGLGLGVPALMSDGYLAFGPNLGWADVPLGALLEGLFPFPVYIDNDTKAAALAERIFGLCEDARTFVYVAGHSGVGGGLFLGGTLYRGAHGYAGEVGHMKLVPGGRACGCGGRGCLEAYVSERAVLEGVRAVGVTAGSFLEVAAALRRAPSAPLLRALEGPMTLLGVGVANLVSLLDPERVVIGGALSALAAEFAPLIRESADEHLPPPLRGSYELLFSPFAEEAVPMGGAALALEGFLALPDSVMLGALPG